MLVACPSQEVLCPLTGIWVDESPHFFAMLRVQLPSWPGEGRERRLPILQVDFLFCFKIRYVNIFLYLKYLIHLCTDGSWLMMAPLIIFHLLWWVYCHVTLSQIEQHLICDCSTCGFFFFLTLQCAYKNIKCISSLPCFWLTVGSPGHALVRFKSGTFTSFPSASFRLNLSLLSSFILNPLHFENYN
jgi:hypothetical protein